MCVVVGGECLKNEHRFKSLSGTISERLFRFAHPPPPTALANTIIRIFIYNKYYVYLHQLLHSLDNVYPIISEIAQTTTTTTTAAESVNLAPANANYILCIFAIGTTAHPPHNRKGKKAEQNKSTILQ